MVATRSDILAEYENALHRLGWRAGLIVPRHIGEGQWLTLNGAQGDGLLLSSSEHGFTAVVFRGKQPIIVRTVVCETDECEDELFRLLLFYRDRRGGEADQPGQLSRVLVVGNLLTKNRAVEIVSETLGAKLRPLDANDLGLQLATRELSFDAIAAPAGWRHFRGSENKSKVQCPTSKVKDQRPKTKDKDQIPDFQVQIPEL